jgi:TolA-binding protein
MKQRECARSWEVDALREGRLGTRDAASFERHTAGCVECRKRFARDEHLKERALALPVEEPTELELRRLRSRVLSDVATGSTRRATRRRPILAFLTALLVVGPGLWLLLAGRATRRDATTPAQTTETVGTAVATPPSLAGSVSEIAPSRWSQLRSDAIERVSLEEGAIRVHVRPQEAGERFLVVLPDGEIEVRGTTFDVSVARGATTHVQVDEGIVDLRLAGQAPLRLGAGEAWTSPPPPDRVTAAPTAPSLATPTPRPAAAPPASASEDGAQTYAGAVRLLRDGRDGDAASAFHALVMAHPHSPEAEDASYLEAVALARAGRGDAAALAAEHHMASFPASFHRKEAAILVARAAAQRGDCERARAVVAPWAGTAADAEVSAALHACDGK